MNKSNRLSPLKSKKDYTPEISFIENKIPKRIKINTFPFYTGELETNLSTKGYKVSGLTNKFVVNEFWQTLNRRPKELERFVSFFTSKPVDEMGFFLQKEWFKANDPLSRSALFFILQNGSSEALASKGDVTSVSKDITKLLKRWNNTLFEINFYNKEDEEMIHHLPLKNGMFFLDGGRVSNEFLEDSSYGIDETFVSNKEILSLMFTNYEPWACSFSPSQVLFNLAQGKANIYCLDRDGEKVERSKAFRCIVSNV